MRLESGRGSLNRQPWFRVLAFTQKTLARSIIHDVTAGHKMQHPRSVAFNPKSPWRLEFPSKSKEKRWRYFPLHRFGFRFAEFIIVNSENQEKKHNQTYLHAQSLIRNCRQNVGVFVFALTANLGRKKLQSMTYLYAARGEQRKRKLWFPCLVLGIERISITFNFCRRCHVLFWYCWINQLETVFTTSV